MNPNQPYPLSFENTEYAFAYKSDKELKKANWLFAVMGNSFLVNMGVKLTPLAIKWRIPFTKTILRKTIFKQFVGGESLEKTKPVASMLCEYGVKVILDYGVEGGEGETAFDDASNEFINVIKYASQQNNIPFISIKITGIARFALLEKIDSLMNLQPSESICSNFENAVEKLDDVEKKSFIKFNKD